MNLSIFLLSVLGLALAVSAGSFPRVRIFSPQNGTIWFGGETRTIFWRVAYIPPPPLPPTLNITLRRKSDESFRMPLATLVPTELGKFNWKIPAALPSQDDYYVRLLPNRFYPGKPNIMASKSKPFTIINKFPKPTTLDVVQPTDSSIWYGGQIRFIQWKFDGLDAADATISIFIEDIKNGVVGKPHPYVIASKLPAVPASADRVGYRWQIPYSFRTSDGYQVRLVAEYPNRPEMQPITAVQKGTFTIIQVGDAGRVTPTAGPVLPLPTN